MTWFYKGKEFTQEMMPDGVVGFVYVMTDTRTGQMYIGKKNATRKVTKPPLKGKTRKRRSVAVSDWETYYSSSDEIKRRIELYGAESFTREIVSFAFSKGELSYLELKEQVNRDVLYHPDQYLNSIVQVRIHRKHLLSSKSSP